MAFIDQVQDLTSLTVSDNDELSQFLQDGVIDVTTRCLIMRPQDLNKFMAVTAEQTSNGADLNGAKIIKVIRENGTNNQWRSCRKIDPGDQYNVTDIDSLEYASKINPVYMEDEDGKISVFPTPDVNPDAYKIYYVNNNPVDHGGSALAHNDTTIKYFPSDKIYLVIIYAGMKLLQAAMGAKTISDLSITAVPPDTPSAPSFDTVTVSATTARAISASAPTFTAPTVGGADEQLTATMDADSAGYGTEADFLNFSKWFSVASEFIEDEEDTELAAAQLQKINSYISAYQAEIQVQLNEFNEANVAYQQDIQEALSEMQVAATKAQKDADFAQQKTITSYANKLQRYQNEITAYSADVNNQVQEYTANLQADNTEYQWLEKQYSNLKEQYDTAFAMQQPKQQATR
tara:strand:- start:4294 stop:5505 length:1212 start_codon:yes stop_codon:yes gene_type:complete